jgi:hypothetical protein
MLAHQHPLQLQEYNNIGKYHKVQHNQAQLNQVQVRLISIPDSDFVIQLQS